MFSRIFKKAGAAAMAAAMVLNGSVIGAAVTDAADSAVTTYEFEDAVLSSDITVESVSGASGGSVAYMQSSGSITMSVDVASTGMYTVTIYAYGVGGSKINNISINGAASESLAIPEGSDSDFSAIEMSVKLTAGTNTIEITPSWGWSKFDKLTVESAVLPDIIATQPYTCDTEATAETQSLMAYLAEVYGSHIISGQQEIYKYGPHDFEYEFEYLNDLTGHYPALRGFDFGNIICPAFQSDDDPTSRVIDWVGNRGGIAEVSIHINVPTDFASYTIGSDIGWDNTTYSQNTDFSPANASVEGTKENEYYHQALETLAASFKTLQDQGIPVIFRPLHEAEGGGGETGSWFWWGREGSQAYKDLWVYTYETMTEEFGLHNLIWAWNSYNYETSANWYPGDDYVDIIGYDKYNCTVYLEEDNWAGRLVHNDSAISSTFYGIMQKYNSAKMVAMMENDCFSTVENLTTEKAGWLYFMTWYDGGSDNINFLTNPIFNTEEDTINMYQSDYCITLDELPEDLYGQSIVDRTTVSTTTTTTTTQDPNVTTTTTAFTFKSKSYTVTLPEADQRDTIILEIEGAATASIGGGIGYGTSAADWVNLEWSGNADSDGKLSVPVDISEIPESFSTVEVQIWWSNVWDSKTETATDYDCDLVDYSFTTHGMGDILYGDANCNENVDLSDAVLILQSQANPDKYGVNGTDENHITEDGMTNADCCDPGDGVTPKDALAVQKYQLHLVTLPEYSTSEE